MSIKKKMGMGFATMAVGAALIGGGTFAYFNDVETSSGNTFATGTIDLKPEIDGAALFSITNQRPGQSFSGSYTLSNGGTLDIGEIKLTGSYTTTDGETKDQKDYDRDGTVGNNADLATQLVIDSLKFKGANVTVADKDGDGKVTLADLTGQTIQLAGLNVTASGVLEIAGHFHNETNATQNEYQGDGVSVNLSFEALQEDWDK
ncbi:TasA family protein [Neobacillus niacini]|uniref:TasA family protein n=1 Tax=Neobacillus niacini TaxID=86668 RepID=UPI0039838FBA